MPHLFNVCLARHYYLYIAKIIIKNPLPHARDFLFLIIDFHIKGNVQLILRLIDEFELIFLHPHDI